MSLQFGEIVRESPQDAEVSFGEIIREAPKKKPLEFGKIVQPAKEIEFGRVIQETQPEEKKFESILAQYRPEVKTPEEIQMMSYAEKRDYADELNRYREVQKSSGIIKGTLSGASFGLSEYIPGLKPTEEDILTSVGSTIGSILPISKMYNLLGKPIVKLAAKSPVARKGLMALGRMTGFGITGAAHEAVTELVKHEVPDPNELLRMGSRWAAIDALLQTLGLGTSFGVAVKNIAKNEGVTSLEVLNSLWNSTKKFSESKFGIKIKKPTDITVETVEDIASRAAKAEAGGLETIDVGVEPVVEKPVETKSEPIKKTPIKTEPVIEPKAEAPTIYRGYGRPEKESVYSGVSEPLLGQGKYYAFDQDVAKEYGPNIEEKKLDVKNPLVITNDNEWRKLAKEAKWPLPNISGMNLEETKKYIDKMNSLIKEKGNDSVIIKFDEKALNDDAKLLKSVFGSSQVYIPKETLKVQEAPTVAPSEKKQKPIKKEESLKPEYLKPIAGERVAKKRSEILEIFRKAFNDPIRLGKIPKKFAGLHAGWPKVTRLLKDNDIETAAHEIGHNLHYTMFGGDAKNAAELSKNTISGLSPYADELDPLGDYEPKSLEGFAEFTRMYVTNPDAAEALAPKFYRKFEEMLGKDYPSMKDALLTSREYYRDYLEGTPESRVDAQISFGSDINKVTERIENIKEALNANDFKKNFLDQFYPAKTLVAEALGIKPVEVDTAKSPLNLYRNLRVLKGAIGKADVYILHETFDPITLKKNGESLRSILVELPTKQSEREFNRYLVARRVLEKGMQNIETGISLEDALATTKKYEKKYNNLAKRLDKYNDRLLEYLQKSGLLSEEQVVKIKQTNMLFTPLQRVIKGKERQGVSSTIQAKKPIKRMKGSTRDIIAPLESIIKNTYVIILNAEKNMTGKVLGELSKVQNIGKYVERVRTPITVTDKLSKEEVIKQMEKFLTPDSAKELYRIMPDFFMKFGATSYPAGENIVTVFYDGKPRYFEVSPDLFEMWNKGTAPYTSDILTKILRMPARFLRAGAILNPKFVQKNFIRDGWGSWLFTQYGKSIKNPVDFMIDTLYEPLAKLASAAKQDNLYVEWLKSGGGMSTMQSMDRINITKKINEIKKGVRPYEVMKFLRKIGEISEEANRLNEFAKALEAEQDSRLGREIAAFASRDLSIDFAKMGLQTKALNQIIPFFNATIQGGDKFIRTMANKDVRNEFMARGVGLVAIPALILAWLNKDDENVKEFQNQERDFNFITKIGNTYLKIPVPFETGVILNGLTQRMFDYFINKNPKAFEGLMGSILDAAMPNFIPAFANPFIEVYANKNFFTGGRVIPLPLEKLSSELQYKTYTSLTARMLGRAINYMVGAESQSKTASPVVIDHFIRSWTGGLGQLAVKLSDEALEKAGFGDKIPKPYQHIADKLGLNAFVARYPRASTQSIEEFYNNYNDALSRYKSIEYAEKNLLKTPEEIAKSKERFYNLYDKNVLDGAYTSIQEAQKTINNIMKNPDFLPKEKREMIDKIYLQMIEFARKANSLMPKNKKTK